MNTQSIATSQFTFPTIMLLLGAIGVVSLLSWYIGRALESVSNARPRARFLVRVVEWTLRILLWFGALAFALRLLAPSQNVLLIAIGLAVIAVGFSSRDLIGNLIGGLLIIVERPYEVGDRVTVAGASGEVRRIGLGATKITTPHGALVTIPNSKLLEGIAQNENAGTPECTVVTEIFLPPDTDPELALRLGRETLITCPYLCLRRPTAINLVEGLSPTPYLSLKLKGYVYDHRFDSEMHTDLVRRCKVAFRDFVRPSN